MLPWSEENNIFRIVCTTSKSWNTMVSFKNNVWLFLFDEKMNNFEYISLLFQEVKIFSELDFEYVDFVLFDCLS